MKRGELRPVALSKGLLNPVCSGANSSTYIKEKSLNDSGASKTTFQILTENCGFKVIKEEGKDNLDCHSENNRDETTIIQGSDNVSSRWEKDDSQVAKDVIVVSRVNNVMDSDKNEQKSTETYLVTRNSEDVAPKVDFLDMTDVSDTLESCLPNGSSKKCKIAGEHNSVDEAAEQEGQRNSFNGHRRWPRYKIMKPEQWNAKSRSKDDRNKTSDGLKLNGKTSDRSKSPHVVGASKESQPQVFKLPSRRAKPRILLCNSSSVLTKDDKCVGEKGEMENRMEHNNSQACNTATLLQAKGSNQENNDGQSVDSHPGGSQAFSNMNSSCLNQGAAKEIRLLPPTKNTVGGMLSYLRKISANTNSESKGSLRDSFSKQVPASGRHFFNRQSHNKTAKFRATDKQFDRASQIRLSTAKLKKKAASSFSQQQNVSPRKLKMKPGMSKFEIRTYGLDKENASTRFAQLYRTANEVPVSSSMEKGIHSTTFRLDRNRPQDYNINFNSEEGCDDSVSFNSFIGYYLCELWKNQCLCDVRIKVGNTSFLAHKIVLAAFTDIFCPDDPHQIPTVSFDIPDVTEEAISLILQYLYTSKMEVTDSVLEAVYTAASILEIGEITDLVRELLSKPTVQNFERIGLPANIMEVYNDFVLENLLEIEDSPYILGMQLPDIEKLLRDPNVKINCEADIVRMIIKWLKYNPCHRTRHAAELLTLVDFDCIGPETLSSIVEQNRHLFDLASMDIIMGAFKKFALRCKDVPMKDPQSHGNGFKGGKTRCFCGSLQNMVKDTTGNYSDEAVCEGHKPCFPEPSPVEDRYNAEVEHRSRKICAISPQDIRKCARHYSTGQVQVDSTAYKGCSQNEASKRSCKSGQYSGSHLRPEVHYTIRQKKKNLCDSSNNFPSEYCDLRSRSSSSESRRGQFCRGLNSSRSDTDTGQLTPVCDCCYLHEGHLGRKRAAYTCSGNTNYEPDNEKDEPECSSNYIAGLRQSRDGKKSSRRFSCNQVCQRSRSSSLSSGSSLRYNASSSGSSKRVTFS